MSNQNFDDLNEQPVKIETGLNSITDFLEPYYQSLGDGKLSLLGIKTGLDDLDKKTLGLSGLIVLAGIAGQGKTSLALQLAFDACELGTPTIIYSLEMPKRAIFTKILNRLAQIKFSDILLKGRLFLDETRQEKNLLGEEVEGLKYLTKDQITSLRNAKEKLAKVGSDFYVRSRETGEAEIDFDSVEREINFVKAKHNADKVLVVIDHLQVFNAGDKYKDQIDKEGKLITGFKGISERTGATIILISQKNKAGFTSTGLQTVKGSVDIVYLADLVMFLESENEREANKKNDFGAIFDATPVKKIDLVIEKNRYNAPCKIVFDFNGEYSTFSKGK